MAESDCSACSGGSYCDVPGLTTSAGPCTQGFYCTSGVNISSPEPGMPYTGIGGRCTPGSECPLNSSYPSPCKPGTYAPVDSMAACSICPAGKCK